MKPVDMKEQLADVFSSASCPPEVLARLERMAKLERGAKSSVGGRTASRWSMAWIGLIAAAIVLLLGNVYWLTQSVDSQSIVEQTSDEPESPRPSGIGADLVVVRIHADWCGRSPEIAPLFAELSRKFGNQPVLFVTLDITDDQRRKEAERMASALGIESVLQQPFESGMLKLIDRRQGEALAVATDRQELPVLEDILAQVLPVRH